MEFCFKKALDRYIKNYKSLPGESINEFLLKEIRKQMDFNLVPKYSEIGICDYIPIKYEKKTISNSNIYHNVKRLYIINNENIPVMYIINNVDRLDVFKNIYKHYIKERDKVNLTEYEAKMIKSAISLKKYDILEYLTDELTISEKQEYGNEFFKEAVESNDVRILNHIVEEYPDIDIKVYISSLMKKGIIQKNTDILDFCIYHQNGHIPDDILKNDYIRRYLNTNPEIKKYLGL